MKTELLAPVRGPLGESSFLLLFPFLSVSVTQGRLFPPDPRISHPFCLSPPFPRLVAIPRYDGPRVRQGLPVIVASLFAPSFPCVFIAIQAVPSVF